MSSFFYFTNRLQISKIHNTHDLIFVQVEVERHQSVRIEASKVDVESDLPKGSHMHLLTILPSHQLQYSSTIWFQFRLMIRNVKRSQCSIFAEKRNFWWVVKNSSFFLVGGLQADWNRGFACRVSPFFMWITTERHPWKVLGEENFHLIEQSSNYRSFIKPPESKTIRRWNNCWPPCNAPFHLAQCPMSIAGLDTLLLKLSSTGLQISDFGALRGHF